MGNLENALQQLRAERREAQSHVEKLDQAISLLVSLNGTGTPQKVNQPTGITSALTGTMSAPTRIISAASRRRMARAQRARWARVRKQSQPALVGAAPVKRTMSAAARRKISAFQRARWAKLRAGQKKAA